jgi:hypothetical protein
MLVFVLLLLSVEGDEGLFFTFIAILTHLVIHELRIIKRRTGKRSRLRAGEQPCPTESPQGIHSHV